MVPDRLKAAREILAFYLEAGVDTPMGEIAIDRLSEPAPEAPAVAPLRAPAGEKPAAPREAPARAAPAALPPPDEAAMAARAAAAGAPDLASLRAILEKFDGCGLKQTAKRLVFADGNPQARLMFVGEAPGKEEDLEGLPFVGRSGKLLDLMIGAIGLTRQDVYIANIIPWRPPGNRDPSLHEVQTCLPFIRRQIELVDPDVMVCLGKPSTAALLGVTDGIRRIRGRWFTYNTGLREIRAMPTFHPAYLLRSPIEKRFAWRDLVAIRKALG